ncbi:segregation/condensation protein A [Candidatus Giovannonibacteria bacterium]|nr:segregation/condensation protein A [Candidatus Giovannonibacteria bacterium]
MTYRVKIEGFEGPLNLLLDLIEAKKLPISAVSLAKITDEYLTYIKSLKNFQVAEVASFLVVASTLMLIKSRSLLPNFQISPEEQQDISDLEARLKLLKRIRDLSLHIKKDWGKREMFSREAFQGWEASFIEPQGITINTLESVLAGLIRSLPKISTLPQKSLEKVISLEEKMLEIVTRISERMKMSFHEALGTKSRTEVIVGFLALLELVRQGVLLVKQEERFGKIEFEKRENSYG